VLSALIWCIHAGGLKNKKLLTELQTPHPSVQAVRELALASQSKVNLVASHGSSWIGWRATQRCLERDMPQSTQCEFCVADVCREDSTETIARTMWTALVEFSHLDQPCSLPEPATWDEQIKAAAAFRDHMQRECEQEVCSVCSTLCRACDVADHVLSNVEHIELLDAAGPKTAEHPRAALTTWTWHDTTYCLQPAACREAPDGADAILAICKACSSDLDKGRIPAAALVNIDTGQSLLWV
jgi:hypothetical protein